MKRFLVIAIVACVSMTAFAQGAKKKNTGLIGKSVDASEQTAAYGMAGCGVGSILFGETDSRVGQVFAATTNDYFLSTFAMSSGTSNCVPENSTNTAQIRKNMEMFVAANKESLANDIAKSNGETITAISNLMGCTDPSYLGAKLQARYETIFTSKEDTVVTENMMNTVSTDRYLMENCKI